MNGRLGYALWAILRPITGRYLIGVLGCVISGGYPYKERIPLCVYSNNCGEGVRKE